MWRSKITPLNPISDISRLPTYGFQFFIRNIGSFRVPFILLTACSTLSALLRFYTVLLLGHIVSHIDTLSLNRIFLTLLPSWILAVVSAEVLDFFIRRYSEALPTVFAEHTQLRFLRTFLEMPSYRMINVSKERLLTLTSKYVLHAKEFLTDWIWGTTFKLTRLAIILCILAYQDVRVFAANVVYMGLFLALSFRISSRFSVVARRFTSHSLESSTAYSNFFLHLNTVKRLGARSFVLERLSRFILGNWDALDSVRRFHAWRWFFQLNLFNLLYIGTLATAIYQIKDGALPLGYLVLIMWAFNELWNVLVHFIEYYVSLVQQREETAIIQSELNELISPEDTASLLSADVVAPWRVLTLRGVQVQFPSSSEHPSGFTLQVDSLSIRRGAKIGIIGPSGAGKTAVLSILMNLIPYTGEYRLDEISLTECRLPHSFMTLISGNDPLFRLTLRENILLGRELAESQISAVLQGVAADDFTRDLSRVVGQPDFNLSAGQEQRIRLARGLLQESEIYLLDEPLNGIDPSRKERIIDFLKGHLKNKTVIMVTHIEQELRLVDEIFEIAHGRLVQKTQKKPESP